MSNPRVLQENSEFGEFRLIKQLGRGGMAEVYLAQVEGVGGFQRNLALKVIHPQLSHDQEFVQMLIDEAKLSVQLNHPNIVHIHNLGQVHGMYYIAMEFIDGCDVYQALVKSEERDEVFPVDVSALIAHETCAGLYYAHTRKNTEGHSLNIIHRDISPQNIQLSREGEVKIVDFGIAKAEQRTSHTQQGVIKGKYSYMSPEQAWGDEVDQRSDIFSLGICLYEMLAGEVLYDAEDGLGLLEQVRLAQVPNLRVLRPEVSPELEQIVYRALAAEPSQRFQTAEDMRNALAGYLYRSGVRSGRQRLTQFLDHLLNTTVYDQAHSLHEDDGITRALSASDFESLEAPSQSSQSNQNNLSSSHQDRTKALSAEAFAQLQSPQLSVDHRDTDQPLINQDPTRAVRSQAFSQLKSISEDTPVLDHSNMWGGHSQIHYESEEKTRAIDRSQLNVMSQGQSVSLRESAPVIMHAPSLNQPVPQVESEEATRAINAQALQDVKSHIQSPSSFVTQSPNPSAPQPTSQAPMTSSTTLPLFSPISHEPSSTTPNVAPVSSSHMLSAPVPFTSYTNEECTRAVDLSSMSPKTNAQNPYVKQVFRDTSSVPELPETGAVSTSTSSTPTPPVASSQHDMTSIRLGHGPIDLEINRSFPDPQPRKEMTSPSPAVLNVPHGLATLSRQHEEDPALSRPSSTKEMQEGVE